MASKTKSSRSPDYQINDIGGKITVKTPHQNEIFIKGAKELGGRWNGVDKVWQFSAATGMDAVKKLCKLAFEGPAVDERGAIVTPGSDLVEGVKSVGKGALKVGKGALKFGGDLGKSFVTVNEGAEKVLDAIPTPVTKIASGVVKATSIGVKTVAYGMNGMRGVSNAATFTDGVVRKLKPSGVQTNHTLGLEERLLEQRLSR